MKTVLSFLFVFTVMANNLFGEIILQQDFNKMELGGDPIGNQPGILLDLIQSPWDITTEPGKLTLPENPVYTPCNATTLAVNFFSTGVASPTDNNGALSDSYKTLRGMPLDWTGQRVFESPGYITFGTSSGDARLTTSGLGDKLSTPADVKVSFQGATENTTIAFRNKVSVNNSRAFSLDDILVETVANVSIPAVTSNDIAVYANQADGKLYFTGMEIVKKVEIINANGHVVSVVNKPTHSLAGIPSGVYIVRFTTEDNNTINKKISK
jgi:hypothetical protein